MYVCICQAVTERQVREAVQNGVQSLRGLREHLGVGSDCGHCARCAHGILKECRNCPRQDESLACDLKLEHQGHALYVEAIAHCEAVKDYVSRELLESIQEDTEEHIDYLETQIGLIEKVGLPNYLQTAMGGLGN